MKITHLWPRPGVHLDLQSGSMFGHFRSQEWFGGVCFFRCVARRVLSAFSEVFFSFRVPLTWENRLKSLYFKNRVSENTKKKRHGIILELQMSWHWHFWESFWRANLWKIQGKVRSRKTHFLNNRQNARPGAITPFDPTQDVRARRPNGAIFNGKVKAESQKAPHLGPGFKPKGGTSNNQTQNYQ